MEFPFRYHLGEKGLAVRFFGMTVRRIYYSDMLYVEPRYRWWNEHFNNLYPFQCVTIRRKSGLIKNFVINPPDRDKFVEQLRGKIPKG